jgi:transcriptional repressor NrdR
MHCPFCQSDLSQVVDKRSVKGSGEIRRRRECLKCHRRYTTYERVSPVEYFVIKRDGRRELFDSAKLRSGLERALEKRPSVSEIDKIVGKIEKRVKSKDKKEIETKVIGREVLSELKKLDKVAYIRFVSVYRQFEDPGDFSKELKNLISPGESNLVV